LAEQVGLGPLNVVRIGCDFVNLTITISLVNAFNRMAISFRNTPQAAIEN
jgi:hypothetical protein